MTMLAIAGLIFLGIHAIPATRLRSQAISAMGEDRYMGAFVVLSLASFFFWAWSFEHAPVGLRAWYYPDWWPWVKAVILLFAFVLFVGGVSSPNPTAVRQGQLLDRPDVGAGIFAITRHPLMWAFGLWGTAHFISQPDWRGFWFFAIFAITALGGAWLQEQRKARQYGAGWERFAAKTSFVPFVALARGRARLSLAEIGWWRIILAVVLWAAILHLHPLLFGVSPLPGLR
jgi:uncharacterized membrane protein